MASTPSNRPVLSGMLSGPSLCHSKSAGQLACCRETPAKRANTGIRKIINACFSGVFGCHRGVERRMLVLLRSGMLVEGFQAGSL